MFAITFCHVIFISYNMTLRHHVFRLWFYAWNLLNVSRRKSLVLKDSDTDSENLSSLIWLFVSDGQKTDSSQVVSLGI